MKMAGELAKQREQPTVAGFASPAKDGQLTKAPQFPCHSR